MNNLAISPEEQQQYQQHFNSANPVNGKLSGAVARTTLMQSGLPTHQLGEIWELADIDKDGALDFDEYCVALKLVFSLLSHAIPGVPPVLPPSLIPQSKYQHFAIPQASPHISEPQPAKMEWYVPGEDRARFQAAFGQQARGSSQVRMLDMEDYLLSMGVSRAAISQAWALVDVRRYQQLNQEQFIYLMHILNAHMRGTQLPQVLPPAVKDAIYSSLSLSSLPSKQAPDSRKPGLYGEKSGNVALADSYLSKLKTSSTFKNDAGSRYASAGKRAEEERKLRAELRELDEELERLQSEYEKAQSGSHESQLKQAVEELEQLKRFKERGPDAGSEPLQDIKQSIFQLEGHLSFLMSEKRAMDEFIAKGRQELLDLQMEKVKL
ncbi:endocytosis defective- protein [Coemansia sp. RSA 990]|nr:cytoskeletal-regulatory complex EF hand-domain-containing protein [Coemansia mojavensis]KAJ1872529.1 endocytosis defective- protein [Coemansia sp. RSA 990]